MSGVPVFGHAVQAPIVTAPNAVPRVSANQRRRRGRQAAATAKANRRSEQQAHDRSESIAAMRSIAARRSVPAHGRCGALVAAQASDCAAPLGVAGARRGRRARALASSIMRSTRSSTSIAALGQHGRAAARRRAGSAPPPATCGAAGVGAGRDAGDRS